MTGQFLKRDFFKATLEKINEKKMKNIVIIAGSHSGFSAAWLMLNGPATHNRNNQIKKDVAGWDKMGDAVLKQN